MKNLLNMTTNQQKLPKNHLKGIKSQLAFLLCLFIVGFGYGQNLVPNPSFEEIINCPQGWAEINSANNWYSPNSSSPDLFNICSSPLDVGVPQNGAGFQYAKNGNGYVGVVSSFDSNNLNYREYIQVELTDTLKANKKYVVSFFVNKADSCPIAIKKIGAYLSGNAISASNGLPLNVTPQIESPSNLYLTDTINWFEVKDTLIAVGGEKYLTIGYFYDNINADTLVVSESLYFYEQAYYYVDDVSVIEVLTNSIEEYDAINSVLSVYPNPVKSSFSIMSSVAIERVELFNINGKLEKVFDNEEYYDVSNLNQGVFFVKITLLNNSFIYRKLIINP